MTNAMMAYYQAYWAAYESPEAEEVEEEERAQAFVGDQWGDDPHADAQGHAARRAYADGVARQAEEACSLTPAWIG